MILCNDREHTITNQPDDSNSILFELLKYKLNLLNENTSETANLCATRLTSRYTFNIGINSKTSPDSPEHRLFSFALPACLPAAAAKTPELKKKSINSETQTKQYITCSAQHTNTHQPPTQSHDRNHHAEQEYMAVCGLWTELSVSEDMGISYNMVWWILGRHIRCVEENPIAACVLPRRSKRLLCFER